MNKPLNKHKTLSPFETDPDQMVRSFLGVKASLLLGNHIIIYRSPSVSMLVITVSGIHHQQLLAYLNRPPAPWEPDDSSRAKRTSLRYLTGFVRN